MGTSLDVYATRSVPRYTSYPTAPHFSTAVGADDYGRWLSAVPEKDPISLYLHVPFCRELCWYCGCNMKLAKGDGPITGYIDHLLTEIELVADHLPARMKVSHLHWGGGTPTAQRPEDLARSMDAIRARFDILPDAELAIESDPRTLTQPMIDEIGRQGFTRASFGVQEFDLQVQMAINRLQPPAMVARAVDGLRAAGVTGINFDLIYGLPFQTRETLLKTIQLCAGMRPDRLALFGYAHVPWMAKRQRLIDQAALPGAAERLDQAKAAAAAIADAGYVAIGLDHFSLPQDDLAVAARKGTLRRNFQGYTTDTANTLLGLGATSIGRTPDGFVQNIAETGAWSRAVAEGQLPVGKGVGLSPDDRRRGAIIEDLMCNGRADLSSYARDDQMPAGIAAELDDMAAAGMIQRNGLTIRMTPSGAPFVRVVAALFDAYLPKAEARNSVAV